MIDWNRVSELKSEVGEEDFAEVIDMFLEEVAEVLGGLENAGPEALADGLHFVKGSALNIGFAKVSEHCQAAEVTLRGNPAEIIDLAGIREAFAASVSAIGAESKA